MISCIYCGKPTKKVYASQGEHILPKAIGGKHTISSFLKSRGVCEKCNNQDLSNLDNELCSRSPLSVIAAREFTKDIHHLWDVNREDNNLLLEASLSDSKTSLILWPQVVFENDGITFYSDRQECEQFGFERFKKVLTTQLLYAFATREKKKKRKFHVSKTPDNSFDRSIYRYPPRVFTRHRMTELTKPVSFELRYLDSSAKRFALSKLENWNANLKIVETKSSIGSIRPLIDCNYDSCKVYRCLLKMALNIIAAKCPNTPVNSIAFPEIIRVITKGVQSPSFLHGNGFIRADETEPIRIMDAHTVLLQHYDRRWHVMFSFFGGKVGAFVQFVGPNHEPWNRMKAIFHLNECKPEFICQNIIVKNKITICWNDPEKIIPSFKIHNISKSATIEVKSYKNPSNQ